MKVVLVVGLVSLLLCSSSGELRKRRSSGAPSGGDVAVAVAGQPAATPHENSPLLDANQGAVEQVQARSVRELAIKETGGNPSPSDLATDLSAPASISVNSNRYSYLRTVVELAGELGMQKESKENRLFAFAGIPSIWRKPGEELSDDRIKQRIAEGLDYIIAELSRADAKSVLEHTLAEAVDAVRIAHKTSGIDSLNWPTNVDELVVKARQIKASLGIKNPYDKKASSEVKEKTLAVKEQQLREREQNLVERERRLNDVPVDPVSGPSSPTSSGGGGGGKSSHSTSPLETTNKKKADEAQMEVHKSEETF